jgi:hypothetical protein
MAVPRPLLLALLGVILLSATFVASRNAQDSAGGSGKPANQAAAPALGHPPAAAKPNAHAAKPAPRTAPKSQAPARPAAPPQPPRALVRALEHRRIVVLAFFQHGSDDVATRHAVASVRGMRGVSLFTASLTDFGRYSPVVGGVGIDRAPAVVIVDHQRRAHLVEAYVDAQTLRQEIADARS